VYPDPDSKVEICLDDSANFLGGFRSVGCDQTHLQEINNKSIILI